VLSDHSSDTAALTGTALAKNRSARRHAAKHHGAKRNGAIASMRAAVTLGAKASTVPPLQWWRTLPADSVTAEQLTVVKRAVSGIGMVGEPRWADAAWGHPAAAVAVALRVMEERRPLAAIVDLTMSTVLIAAVRANAPDAIAVLLMMIARMGADAEKDAFKRSWLNRQRKADGGRVAVVPAPARVRSGG
jgi:hypothetical protein